MPNPASGSRSDGKPISMETCISVCLELGGKEIGNSVKSKCIEPSYDGCDVLQLVDESTESIFVAMWVSFNLCSRFILIGLIYNRFMEGNIGDGNKGLMSSTS